MPIILTVQSGQIFSFVNDHRKLIRYFIRTQYNGVLASQIRHDLLIQVIYDLKYDVTGSGWAMATANRG
ncbi:hypothetical protein [Arsenophonus sp.]|uniref:hypothetical protein n=1 Tax=Arsenophonus sp. TaxID=1872640 RepID=UPI0038792421